MKLSNAYEEAIANQHIQDDPGQRAILEKFQELENALNSGQGSWLGRLMKKPIQGIYLYGSVGVGKTYLMDLFYQHSEFRLKMRLHFHQFMQQVDAQLRKRQGQRDPLRHFAKDFAKKTKLLCLDEFMVKDIAYAMILSELLQALFEHGVVLVMTSNTQPDYLYLHGLQRARFLPAIALIKQHCAVLKLGLEQDYRLGHLQSIHTYLTPITSENQALMTEQFMRVAEEISPLTDIEVQTREIPVIQQARSCIWFDFKVICNLPRSQLDYLELSQRFDTFFVSDIPKLKERDTVFALLFIAFVDVLYDKGLRLILLAEVPLEELYVKGEAKQEFKRTLSRLEEMRSQDYLLRHARAFSNK